MDAMERAEKFYDNEIYDSSYINDYDLFPHTTEQFNPIPKCVNVMKDLSLKKKIDVSASDDNPEDNKVSIIKALWNDNNLQSLKYKIAEDLLVKRKAYIELVKKDNGIILVDHEPSKVEYEDGYCKIEGKKRTFNMEEEEFEEVDVVKEFWFTDNYRWYKETEGEEVTIDRALGFEFLPVVEFTTEYNLEPLFNKTDRINEIKAMKKKLFWLHGDPLAFQTASSGGSNKSINEQSKDKISNNKFSYLRLLNLGENELRYLEMNGNMVDKMDTDIEQTLNEIKNDYPEYELANILSSGNPSGDALKTVAIEILARVDSFRSDISEGFIEVNNKALVMLGGAELDHDISFTSVLPESVKDKIEAVEKLKPVGLFPNEIAVKFLQELYSVAPEVVIEAIESESKQQEENINFSINGGG
ncbi:hypothetical protein [Orenia marismortui]|uniref:hypothetical protein n=1 Tax=Orenia marismortui TaxID=46469 RepID=UPI0010653D2A|nr:hypothetical protein [Orenia marismortui]